MHDITKAVGRNLIDSEKKSKKNTNVVYSVHLCLHVGKKMTHTMFIHINEIIFIAKIFRISTFLIISTLHLEFLITAFLFFKIMNHLNLILITIDVLGYFAQSQMYVQSEYFSVLTGQELKGKVIAEFLDDSLMQCGMRYK